MDEENYRKIMALIVIETVGYYHKYCSLNESKLKYNTEKIMEYFGLYDVIKDQSTYKIYEGVPKKFVSDSGHHLSKYIVRRHGCLGEKNVVEGLTQILEEILFNKCEL
jgi:hypothetical protein